MRERRRRVPLRGGHKLVVVPGETRWSQLRRRIATVIVLLAIPAAGWLGWDAGLRSQAQMAREHSVLLRNQAELERELLETRERYQQIQVDLLVAHESLLGSQSVIGDLEQQLFRLQQDLATYRGALAPNAMVPGLRIQAFELAETDEARVFRYKVMVSRVGSEEETTQAELFLQVEGIQDGKSVELSLADMTGLAKGVGIPLDFRYFQVVPSTAEEAELRLPEGFEPRQVTLRAENNGKKLVEQIFDWNVTGARP
jgi:hypothetical protein